MMSRSDSVICAICVSGMTMSMRLFSCRFTLMSIDVTSVVRHVSTLERKENKY